MKILGRKTNRSIHDALKDLTKIKDNEWYFVSLSHVKLREKTREFKAILAKKTKKIAYVITFLKKQAVENDNIDTKENIFKAIDKKKRYLIKVEEKVLLELLPEAFSILKETAKRFISNYEIVVPITSFDLILSANKPYVKIYKDQALWKSTWKPVGKPKEWDMVYYDAQLLGGIILHNGKIAEMATGEGKTLVATLSIYLNALTGRGVHVVTVNDYLSKRDYAWMAPLMEFHGFSVDCIDNHPPNTYMRRQSYWADITYGSNNEFVFDYLRDNIVHSANETVQRELNYAIVDEIDSVLIDESRTPIIISGPFSQVNSKGFEGLKPQVEKIIQLQRLYLSKTLNEARELIILGDKKKGGFKLLQVYRGFPKHTILIKFLRKKKISSLLHRTEVQYMQDNDREMPKIDENLYFVVNEKNHSIELTEKGIDVISSNIFEQDYYVKSARILTMNQLLKAYIFFEKDIDYVVAEGQVKIVDRQTGRFMEGHRFSNGLHKAIEAKENIKIEEESQSLATMTLHNFYSRYRKLSGMTGTAETYSGEFWHIYKLDVVVIPTHKQNYRKDYQDIVLKTKREKYHAIIEEIIKLSQYERRPVLVGTSSIDVSELLSRMLKISKIYHNILNAKLHKKEADIIAESGKAGMVTIATGMAGRGTNIKLSSESKIAGGLAILGTERHKSQRVDKQLRGRAGRQGDPGTSKFFVSLEDSLIHLFCSYRISTLIEKLGHKEDDFIQHSVITYSLEMAQKKVEETNFYFRKRHHQYDSVLNKQSEIIYSIRKNSLFVDKISVYIYILLYQTIEEIVELDKHFEALYFGLKDYPLNAYYHKIDMVMATYKMKQEHNVRKAFPAIHYLYATQYLQYVDIFFTKEKGIKKISVFLDLKIFSKTNGKVLVQEFERSTVLTFLDFKWREHIIDMEELRNLIQISIYEHPLLIYKGKAFNLFNRTLKSLNKETVLFIFQANLLKINIQYFQGKWKNFIFL